VTPTSLTGRKGFLLLGLTLAACPPRPSTGGESDSYGSTVARWTAQADIYQMEDMRAKFAATLESDAFRRAWVREQARRLELGPSQVEELTKKQRAEADAHTVFILGMFVDPPRDNKLGPSSNWQVTLVVPGAEVNPERIEDLGRPTENQRTLFPFLDNFWRIYRLTFPLQKAQGPWTLRVASDIGAANLIYLEPLGGQGVGSPSGIPTSRIAPEGNL
jgi:hypothetical protein